MELRHRQEMEEIKGILFHIRDLAEERHRGEM
jgi:hypothetical protein